MNGLTLMFGGYGRRMGGAARYKNNFTSVGRQLYNWRNDYSRWGE